jgi:DNA repair protein RadD
MKYAACQTGAGGWYYRVRISGDTNLVPTRLPRKRAPKRRQKKSVLRTRFRVEPCGKGSYYGFTLDGDHLYVDGNFIVHHNSGKSPIIAGICRDAVNLWDGRVLVLAHVKELLEQSVDKLHAVAPDLWNRIGVYSAGLRSRDTEHEVIVAGIQSVYQRACELGPFDLILVDECHLLPPDGEGRYRTFLADAKVVNPNVRLIGLTATPYRTCGGAMSTGMICGHDNLLNHVCYEIGVRELIVQGYLCPLKSKAGKRKVDTSNLHIRGGEFIAGEVAELMDDEDLVRSACKEVVELTADRKSVLIFAAGVQHALHVQKVLGELGHECGFVCGDTLPFERAETIERFKSGELKYLVNVNVLTTGFDAPNIDCVAMLRPTNSPGLYYQMVGRSFRLHPGKNDALVLDYGGNVMRHGPVDALKIESKEGAGGGAPTKECPQCNALIHAAYAHCPECGYEFPQRDSAKHEARASSAGVLSGQITDTEYEVRDVYYSVHTKRGAPEDHPKTLRVEYRIGFNDHRSEWVCFEHGGYARQKAEAWWRARSNEPVPDTAQDAVDICEAGGVAETHSITVRSVAGEKYDRIIHHELGPIPPRLDGSDEREDESIPEYAHVPAADVPF